MATDYYTKSKTKPLFLNFISILHVSFVAFAYLQLYSAYNYLFNEHLPH